MVYRIMHSERLVQVFDYTRELLCAHPEVELHVGCDSQNYRHHTVYVTTMVYRFPGHGGHVIYHKEKVRLIPDLWTKLWGELERSLELARSVESELGVRVKQIDLDFNEDPAYPSHKLLNAATGYAQSLGFEAKAKPNLLFAAWAADVLCH